ncbi:hypothetical protein HanIR_Chr17g0895171 [Helianthus annuus]|nr:hypothetical protein HanIR_Chr17g0895171 [Helianthus annuus]
MKKKRQLLPFPFPSLLFSSLLCINKKPYLSPLISQDLRPHPSPHHRTPPAVIGIAKARTVNPSRVIKEDYEDYEKWLHIRTKGFLQILENLQKIKVGSFNKVNYCSTNCIITSYSGTPLPLHEKRSFRKDGSTHHL